MTETSTSDRRPCPWCAEDIKVAAITCRYCARPVPHGGTIEPLAAGVSAPPPAIRAQQLPAARATRSAGALGVAAFVLVAAAILLDSVGLHIVIRHVMTPSRRELQLRLVHVAALLLLAIGGMIGLVAWLLRDRTKATTAMALAAWVGALTLSYSLVRSIISPFGW
jgi:hypothetical protein